MTMRSPGISTAFQELLFASRSVQMTMRSPRISTAFQELLSASRRVFHQQFFVLIEEKIRYR
jgi:hypothetical protein